MSVRLGIPRGLRRYCEGKAVLTLDGQTLCDVLGDLRVRHPELGLRVVDASGALRPHLVLLRGGEVLRGAALARLRFVEADEVALYSAVSGG